MKLRPAVSALLRAINEPPVTPGRRLVAYYLVLAAIAGFLTYAVSEEATRLLATGMGEQAADPGRSLWFDLRLVATMVVALTLMVPTAWVYTATRRIRGYDQAVVQTLLVLPIAVAGIIVVVQNSLALAFSLAGVVAAVRFRSTLKDSSDMLYIFLAIAVGLAAGVQAFAAASILSATFNFVTLGIWQCGVPGCPLRGQEHSHGAGRPDHAAAAVPPVAADGNANANGNGDEHGKKKKRRFDAILSVQAIDAKHARRAVEEVLAEEAKRWQIDEITPKKSGKTVLKYVVRLDPDKQPDLVLDTLLARGAPHVVGATLR